MKNLLNAVVLLFVMMAAGACGDANESTLLAAEIDPTRVVETWDTPGTDEIQLLVSNQSLKHETVQITIEIDGETFVGRSFDAGDQHNFFSFNVNEIEPGEHTITIRSDTDTELVRSFTKTEEPIWLIVHYWFDEYESKKFTFEISNEPVEFA